MNTKTDTEAPPARTQWIAESLHREKYFDICQNSSNFSSLSLFMPKLTVTLSCHSQRIAWSEFRARAELLKLHFRTETCHSEYFLLCQKILLALTSESCPWQQREGGQLSTFYFLLENYYNFLNGTATTIFLQLCFVKTAKFVFTVRIYNPH